MKKFIGLSPHAQRTLGRPFGHLLSKSRYSTMFIASIGLGAAPDLPLVAAGSPGS